MSAAIDYFESSNQCPPEDTYTLEIVDISREWVMRPSFDNKDVLEPNANITFKIVGVPEDFTEDETAEWFGWTFDKFYKKPKRLSNERGALNNLICAVKGRKTLSDDDKISISELIGERFRADIEATPSGYPKIAAHKPLKRTSAATSRRPAPKVVEETADDEWPEDEE